jgi:Lipase (class 3)
MKVALFGITLATLANASKMGIALDLFNEFKYAAELNLCSFIKSCKTPLGGSKLADISGSATGFVAIDHAKKYINVVMRGSASFKDLKTDQDQNQTSYDLTGSAGCVGCMVQHGLYTSAAGVLPQILSIVATAKASAPDHKIFIAGHSLGGGTAQLVALALRSVYPDNLVLYPSGSTRVGNPAFASFMESKFSSDTATGNFFRITQ